jgi:hypothetical protein
MEINEMLDFAAEFFEENAVSATCVISDGIILITPFEPNEEDLLVFHLPHNVEELEKMGWKYFGPDANGVCSLIPDPEVDNPQEME